MFTVFIIQFLHTVMILCVFSLQPNRKMMSLCARLFMFSIRWFSTKPPEMSLLKTPVYFFMNVIHVNVIYEIKMKVK